ncbi:tRNA adenosine deaminase-associated protein [Nonomuraea soli]|uniref:Putative tRNA adenosine deaminase-associated protein n=1 Tax=Nonomuraea soli TaxID=1032476 RepID=A0A7W0CJ52_9ACTN|nr:tRNA adenosine deaminase-associated protein [Nonomuraea soli]MBA2891890.1 putative tRNA adenosine deaminase-associated protein [Nonomuraea soli]
MPSSAVFAAAFVRTSDGWSGAEVDLGGAEIVDDLGDAVSEALRLSGDELALLCVEVEDEWFAIARYTGADEARVFLSDGNAVGPDPLGELFAEFAGVVPDKESTELGVRPSGDIDLLGDLGMSPEELLELAMEEGTLPADILSVIAEKLGFADELDRLR